MQTDNPIQSADDLIKPFKFPAKSYEYKVQSLRECPAPDAMPICDTPERAFEYWNTSIKLNPYYNPEAECFAVLLLNTRRKIKGHQIVSIGTHDTILVHPLSVFRLAVVTSSPGIIIMHNHPSGEPTPSEADIKVTRDLIKGAQLLKIDLLDHVIAGHSKYNSLRELGYFYN